MKSFKNKGKIYLRDNCPPENLTVSRIDPPAPQIPTRVRNNPPADEKLIFERLWKGTFRAIMKARGEENILSRKTTLKSVISVKESHQLAEANQEKNMKMREALGISQYFVEGSSLDPERKAKEAAAEAAAQAEAQKKYTLVPDSLSSSSSERDVSKEKPKKKKSSKKLDESHKKKKASKKDRRDRSESADEKKKKRSKKASKEKSKHKKEKQKNRSLSSSSYDSASSKSSMERDSSESMSSQRSSGELSSSGDEKLSSRQKKKKHNSKHSKSRRDKKSSKKLSDSHHRKSRRDKYESSKKKKEKRASSFESSDADSSPEQYYRLEPVFVKPKYKHKKDRQSVERKRKHVFAAHESKDKHDEKKRKRKNSTSSSKSEDDRHGKKRKYSSSPEANRHRERMKVTLEKFHENIEKRRHRRKDDNSSSEERTKKHSSSRSLSYSPIPNSRGSHSFSKKTSSGHTSVLLSESDRQKVISGRGLLEKSAIPSHVKESRSHRTTVSSEEDSGYKDKHNGNHKLHHKTSPSISLRQRHDSSSSSSEETNSNRRTKSKKNEASPPIRKTKTLASPSHHKKKSKKRSSSSSSSSSSRNSSASVEHQQRIEKTTPLHIPSTKQLQNQKQISQPSPRQSDNANVSSKTLQSCHSSISEQSNNHDVSQAKKETKSVNDQKPKHSEFDNYNSEKINGKPTIHIKMPESLVKETSQNNISQSGNTSHHSNSELTTNPVLKNEKYAYTFKNVLEPGQEENKKNSPKVSKKSPSPNQKRNNENRDSTPRDKSKSRSRSESHSRSRSASRSRSRSRSSSSRSRSRSYSYSSSRSRSYSSRSHSRSAARSPSIPRRKGSPSFLDKRRITSARKRPVPYRRPSPPTPSSLTSASYCSHSDSVSPYSSKASSFRSRSRSLSWSPVTTRHKYEISLNAR